MNNKTIPQSRDAYLKYTTISTRWNDNDVYGHLNNVIYFELFDTAINKYLIESNLLDINKSSVVGLVVDNQCTYFSSIKFPENVDVGIKTSKVGRTSVIYEIGIFRKEEEQTSAVGTFIHVYVDKKTNIPAPLTDKMRSALEALQIHN
jgi:acyl-CoA thioester hydrolase